MINTIKYLFLTVLTLVFFFGAYQAYKHYQFEKEVEKDWQAFISPYNERRKAMEEAYKKEQEELISRAMERYKLAKQDHYGGKTPEETLKLFVEALKKKDAKLAAKYYLPWEWENAESRINLLLSKPDRYNKFLYAYQTGIIKVVDRAIGKAIKIYENKEDDAPYIMEMTYNQETGIWKIKEF